MADKQQLVYEINIIANGTDKIEGVKKSLESAKNFVDKLNNSNVNVGVNDNFKSNLHTISEDLREVKRGIELLNKGASIKVNGVEQTEQSLRSLEKTLEDTLKSIKHEQLTHSLSVAQSNNKLIPESTWYNRRNALDEVIAKLKEYDQVDSYQNLLSLMNAI